MKRPFGKFSPARHTRASDEALRTSVLSGQDGADVPGRPAKSPHRRFFWWIPAIVLSLIAPAVYFRENLRARIGPPPVTPVRTALVRSGTLEQTLRLTGSTAAEHGVLLRAPNLRGRRSRGGGVNDFRLFLKQLVDPGSYVKKGEVVAAFDRVYMVNRLDNDRSERLEFQAALRLLRAEFEVSRAAHAQATRVARADMEKAQLDLRTAPVRAAIQVDLFRLNFEEAQKLHQSLVTQTRYREAAQAAELRRAELELQEGIVEERRAAANLDRMVARAPMDGVAIVREIWRGSEFSQIRAGDQLSPGQPYVQIVNPRSVIVHARANQVDVDRLRHGAPVHVRFDAYPGMRLPGRLESVGAVAKTGRRRNYVAEIPVTIRLGRMDPRVIPSLSVSADVVIARETETEIVPRGAVFYPPDYGPPYAFVRTPSGWMKRELHLGSSNNVIVSVRSGLDSGDVVAVGDAPNRG